MRPSIVALVAFLTLPLLLVLLVDGADPHPHGDRRTSTDLRAHAASLRALQGDSDLGALTAVCNEATGGVNLAENLSVLLSTADFQPNCTCSEDNNLEDFDVGFGGADGFDIDALNEFFSNLFIDIAWSCENQCATCNPANDICGTFTAGLTADFAGTPTNLTLDDLFSGAFSPDTGFGAFLQGSQMFELCMDYVSGGDGLAGTTACVGNTLGIETFSVNATEQPCMLSYEDQECDSCVIQENGCWVANCSIHGEPMVDSCAETGMDGIFQVLAFYTGAVNRSTLTVGTCAPLSSPTVSLVAPTESPMAGNGTMSPTLVVGDDTSMPVAAPTTRSPVVEITVTQSPVGTASGGDSNTDAPTNPPVSAGSMLPSSQWVVVAAGGALWLLANFSAFT